MVRNPPANTGDTGDIVLIPGSGRSSGRKNGNPPSIFAWIIPWTEESGRLHIVHGGNQESDMTEHIHMDQFSAIPVINATDILNS